MIIKCKNLNYKFNYSLYILCGLMIYFFTWKFYSITLITSQKITNILHIYTFLFRSSMPSRVQVPSSHSPTVNYLDGEGEIGSEVPSSSSKHLNPIQHPPSTSQFNFGRDLDRGIDQLFDYLEVKEHSRGSHRIYDRYVTIYFFSA